MGVGVVVSGEVGVMGTVGVGVGVIVVGDGGGIVLWPPPLQFQGTEKRKISNCFKEHVVISVPGLVWLYMFLLNYLDDGYWHDPEPATMGRKNCST
jgi:hypothetical protein